MTDSSDTLRQQTLRWLAAYAGYPARRLPARAELLLLISIAAAESEEEEASLIRQPSGAAPGQPYNATLRQYTIARRLHAHIKSDNRAKV